MAQYFLRKYAVSHKKQVEEISSAALMRLMSYDYPGNVRELENVLEHAVAVANFNILTEEDLPAQLKHQLITERTQASNSADDTDLQDFFNKGVSLDAELEAHEKSIIINALRRANGVQKRAAELLGINYRSLRHRLDKYNMLGKNHYAFQAGQPSDVTKSVTSFTNEL
jgi:DNA-binding NtrC family response regulator